jgi:hypothetical protein
MCVSFLNHNNAHTNYTCVVMETREKRVCANTNISSNLTHLYPTADRVIVTRCSDLHSQVTAKALTMPRPTVEVGSSVQ